jgi:hypothetical protein
MVLLLYKIVLLLSSQTVILYTSDVLLVVLTPYKRRPARGDLVELVND